MQDGSGDCSSLSGREHELRPPARRLACPARHEPRFESGAQLQDVAGTAAVGKAAPAQQAADVPRIGECMGFLAVERVADGSSRGGAGRRRSGGRAEMRRRLVMSLAGCPAASRKRGIGNPSVIRARAAAAAKPPRRRSQASPRGFLALLCTVKSGGAAVVSLSQAIGNIDHHPRQSKRAAVIQQGRLEEPGGLIV